MSDRDRIDNRAMHGGISGAVGRPGPVHEALYAMLQDMVTEMVADAMPQLAEVVGNDGGAVRVRMDGEDGPREFGFARKHGQRYRNGDRVLVQRLRGGDHVVLGTFSDKQGSAQRAVGADDMDDDAIDRRSIRQNAVGSNELAGGAVDRNHIRSNAVGSDQLANGAVGSSHIQTNAVGSNELAGNSVDTNHLRGNAVTNAKLASGAVDTGNLRDGSVTKAKLAANAAPDLSDYAKKSDLSAYVKASELAKNAKGSKALATEEWVTKNFQKKGSS